VFLFVFNRVNQRQYQMPEEAPADDGLLGLFYSGARVALTLLLAKPGAGPLRNLVPEFHQEHRGGYMGIPLVVPPRQARELDNVAADQAGVAEPDPTLWIDPQARVVVIMQGAAEGDLPPALDSRRSRQFLGQIRDRDEPLRLIYGLPVGQAAISAGVSLGIIGYHVSASSFGQLGVDDLAGLSGSGLLIALNLATSASIH
jgi:hypothetical protein